MLAGSHDEFLAEDGMFTKVYVMIAFHFFLCVAPPMYYLTRLHTISVHMREALYIEQKKDAAICDSLFPFVPFFPPYIITKSDALHGGVLKWLTMCMPSLRAAAHFGRL